MTMECKGKFGGRALSRLLLIKNEISENDIILDAGCNVGSLGKELIKDGHIVYGVDVNPDYIEIAKSRGVFAKVCPVEKLTFPDNFFDICVATELLEHLYRPEEGLYQLYRVLKPKGKLLGTVPSPFGMFSISSKHQHIWHQHDFNEDSLRKLLEKFFEKENIYIKRYYPPKEDTRDRHLLYFRGIK